MSATTLYERILKRTVGLELIVAVSGLMVVGFIFAHLYGNLHIFGGAEPFNAYPEHLREMGALFWVARIGIAVAFVVHIFTAIQLAKKNRAARGESRYAVSTRVGRKTPATQYMLYSGIFIFAFLIIHLFDFTWTSHTGPKTAIGGEEMGLFGLVVNKLGNPIRGVFYIIAVMAVGAHLSHAIASVLVTLGILGDEETPHAERAAQAIGVVIALGFASIPIYVLVRTYIMGGFA
jgi:succinate dehydrogenase / fumarate reductase cytochrome b subunit